MPSEPGSGAQAPATGQPTLRALRRRWPLALAGLVLAVLAWPLLDASFPDGARAVESATSLDAGQKELERVMDAYGGLERLLSAGVAVALIEDEWSPLFSSFSYWPEPSMRVDFAARPATPSYLARFAFPSGELWGQDGDPWVVEHGQSNPDSPKRFRAGYAALETPRLLLLPFAPAIERAKVVLHRAGDPATGSPHILSVRFRKPNRSAEHLAEWRLYIDPNTHLIREVVLEQTAISDAPILVDCLVEGLREAGGLRFPDRYRCAISNRIRVPLFVRSLRSVDLRPETPGMFRRS
ncbi:MAG: hypothetical protein U1E65_01945 [Myxococcota bacterium]